MQQEITKTTQGASMKKLLLPLLLASAFPMACVAASSDATSTDVTNTNQLDNFYVAGNLGQTQYRTDYQITHRNSVFQNVRFGWRWNGLVGAEIGYAYLGRRKGADDLIETSVNSRAATVGANIKYDFYENWFVTAHGGYLRSQRTNTVTSQFFDESVRHTSWDNGWYAGLGVGYDVTKNVSVGLNYDNYHLQYTDNAFHDDVNVAVFSGSVEYRF
jgi:OmpA-OmpF porin, OOP family